MASTGLTFFHFRLTSECGYIAKSVANYISRTMSTIKLDTPVIAIEEARRFMIDCMTAICTPKAHAEALGDLLVEADYRGHFSHGMNRLEMYIKDVQSGLCDCKAAPKILKETPATAWVDGQNGLGAVVGKFCMDLAIEKAKNCGVGWVVAKESNHYGIAGMYALQAIKQGLMGMSFTNTSPLMAPTRARDSALGTNPLSLGAPGLNNNDSFVLDMATTAVAVGKIEIQKRKNAPIPLGWALDKSGHATIDANAAYDARRLMPLGGSEETSGYKGFGLALMVEVLCGISAGSEFGPKIRSWGDNSRRANLGQCFVAINPDCFAPGFTDRISEMIRNLRNMQPVDPEKPVLVAGDKERMHMIAVDAAGGIQYVPDQIKTCQKLSEALKVKPLTPVC